MLSKKIVAELHDHERATSEGSSFTPMETVAIPTQVPQFRTMSEGQQDKPNKEWKDPSPPGAPPSPRQN